VDCRRQRQRVVCAAVDLVAAKSSDETRAAMHAAYAHAARLEWMFWDSAYRLGGWPV